MRITKRSLTGLLLHVFIALLTETLGCKIENWPLASYARIHHASWCGVSHSHAHIRIIRTSASKSLDRICPLGHFEGKLLTFCDTSTSTCPHLCGRHRASRGSTRAMLVADESDALVAVHSYNTSLLFQRVRQSANCLSSTLFSEPPAAFAVAAVSTFQRSLT